MVKTLYSQTVLPKTVLYGTSSVAPVVFNTTIVPLFCSIIEMRTQRGVFASQAPQDVHKQDLENLTGLLGFSISVLRQIATQAGFPLSDQGLTYKLALSPLVATSVGEAYKTTGIIPTQDFAEKFAEKLNVAVQKTIQSVFRHNRLNNETALQEGDQTAYIRGLNGILSCVNKFAFGYQEDQITQIIIGEIEIKTRFVTQKLHPAHLQNAQIDTGLFEVLSKLYVECHYEEMSYLSQLSVPAREIYLNGFGGQFSLEPVWQRFNKRIDLSLALARRLQSS